jgi:hypothetical protein
MQLLCLDDGEVPVPNVLHFHHGVGIRVGDVRTGHNCAFTGRLNRAHKLQMVKKQLGGGCSWECGVRVSDAKSGVGPRDRAEIAEPRAEARKNSRIIFIFSPQHPTYKPLFVDGEAIPKAYIQREGAMGSIYQIHNA